MALMINDNCTACDACKPECPNEAISAARGLATFRFPSVVYLLGGDGHYRRVWEAEARG